VPNPVKAATQLGVLAPQVRAAQRRNLHDPKGGTDRHRGVAPALRASTFLAGLRATRSGERGMAGFASC
jgi:hypothetical protein